MARRDTFPNLIPLTNFRALHLETVGEPITIQPGNEGVVPTPSTREVSSTFLTRELPPRFGPLIELPEPDLLLIGLDIDAKGAFGVFTSRDCDPGVSALRLFNMGDLELLTDIDSVNPRPRITTVPDTGIVTARQLSQLSWSNEVVATANNEASQLTFSITGDELHIGWTGMVGTFYHDSPVVAMPLVLKQAPPSLC